MDSLLIVDDDLGIQKQLKWALSDYQTTFADCRERAIVELRRTEPAVVTLDLGLPPDQDNASEGLKALQEILTLAPNTKVIVVTGNEDRAVALEAIGLGAYDFIQKPIDSATIKVVIERALQFSRLESEYNKLLNLTTFDNGIIGSSPIMQKMIKRAEKVAATDISALILGESGTGKEVFARYLHNNSSRKGGPFIAINCASIPENLLESELFGYERGAFTGANKTTIGKIELADKGTLFLDEIGDMPLSLQSKMLRFIQERVIERLGGRQEIAVDIRLVSATHRNLTEMCARGEFRDDLYFRIGEVVIELPPLRERDEDVVHIAKALLVQYRQKMNASVKGFSNTALDAMLKYAWPGNVRELQNKLKSAVALCETPLIQADDLGLFHDEDQAGTSLNLREVREHAESKAIRVAFQRSGENMSKTAELLGVTRPTLYSLLDKYGLRDLKSHSVAGK